MMEPFSLIVDWYDVPAFDGGGTCVRINNGKVTLHWCHYTDVGSALRETQRLLGVFSTRFENAGSTEADVQKWRETVRTRAGLS